MCVGMQTFRVGGAYVEIRTSPAPHRKNVNSVGTETARLATQSESMLNEYAGRGYDSKSHVTARVASSNKVCGERGRP